MKFKKIICKIEQATDIAEEKSKYYQVAKTEERSDLFSIIYDAILNHSKLLILYRNTY